MKKILLLGGSFQQIIAIKTASELGYTTVLCDYLENNPGKEYADKYYPASTTDKEHILDIARKEEINGIIAYASDPAAPTAAYVAEKMGLPSNPYKSVEILCNKDRFREFLSSNGFNTPMARGFDSVEQAVAHLHRFNLPIIVKPIDSSGSKGVTVVTESDDFKAASEYAMSFSRAHRIIVEDYIEKKHPYLVGGDIFVYDGKIIQWGLMNCHRDKKVNPLVPTGKSFPPLLEMDDLKRIEDTLQRLVTELGIMFGPMNVELIIDKNDRVFPIDIGPRSGGNMIPDLLSMIYDCNVTEMCIRTVMGEKIEYHEHSGKPFYASLNIHSFQDGLFEGIEFSDQIRKYIIQKHIYCDKAEQVRSFNNSADALGIVFFRFPDNKTMIEAEETMSDNITILLS